MTQDLKDSLKIILNGYKEDKLTEEEVYTLLDSIINNGGNNIITYPYPVYPSHPWESPITWKYEQYGTSTTTDCQKDECVRFKTNVTD